MPILAVIGIDEAGKREVLAFSVGERENQANIRAGKGSWRSGQFTQFLTFRQ
jgi:hypothetical protein